MALVVPTAEDVVVRTKKPRIDVRCDGDADGSRGWHGMYDMRYRAKVWLMGQAGRNIEETIMARI